jgi:hypothetical protein
MEDAIDDWLLRQIYWLRREDTIAFGIQWVQDVRTEPIFCFFIKLTAQIFSQLCTSLSLLHRSFPNVYFIKFTAQIFSQLCTWLLLKKITWHDAR